MAEGYHDFVPGETLTAAVLEDYCMRQVTLRFASAAARDAAVAGILIEGLMTLQKDTNTRTTYSGAGWSTEGPLYGALTAWTPAVVQSGAVTTSNTYSRYFRSGRLVTGWFAVTATGAGTASNAITISTPVTAAAATLVVGSFMWSDASIPSMYVGSLFLGSTTTFDLRYTANSATENRIGIIAGVTFAIASGDAIWGQFSYEAAADA